MQSIAQILAQELNQKQEYIENVISLLDEGNTIPFIARYRKEMHGTMDDTTLRNLETRLTYLRNLEQRREEVKKSIDNRTEWVYNTIKLTNNVGIKVLEPGRPAGHMCP